jgi:hypothetical protein
MNFSLTPTLIYIQEYVMGLQAVKITFASTSKGQTKRSRNFQPREKNFCQKRRWRCVVFNQYKYIFLRWQTGCGASLDTPDADYRTLAACLILYVPLGAGEKRRSPAAHSHYIMYTARVCVWPLCNGKFISISSLYCF